MDHECLQGFKAHGPRRLQGQHKQMRPCKRARLPAGLGSAAKACVCVAMHDLGLNPSEQTSVRAGHRALSSSLWRPKGCKGPGSGFRVQDLGFGVGGCCCCCCSAEACASAGYEVQNLGLRTLAWGALLSPGGSALGLMPSLWPEDASDQGLKGGQGC